MLYLGTHVRDQVLRLTLQAIQLPPVRTELGGGTGNSAPKCSAGNRTRIADTAVHQNIEAGTVSTRFLLPLALQEEHYPSYSYGVKRSAGDLFSEADRPIERSSTLRAAHSSTARP